MIVFDVRCSNDHVFEGWFADTETYTKQVKAGDVACPVCGDTKVGKALMAPGIAVSSKSEGKASGEASAAGDDDSVTLASQKERTGQLMAMMHAVRDHVERNFDNVGPKFAEEARRMHYGESEKRSICGQATRNEARELRDEGIEFGQLPDLPKLDG